MKLMRLAMCVAVFALIGGIAFSEDMDIAALKAKMAAQEARLNDLQAKMNSSKGASEATGVVSIRKNAVVTIGGQVNTRYFYYNGKVTPGSGATAPDGTVYAGRASKLEAADFKVSDAKINFKIDVNDYFDAFVRINLQNGARASDNGWSQASGQNDAVSTAQYAWIRWKNICNSGFGILIGRNDLVFGAGDPAGMIEQGWNKNNIWAMDGVTSRLVGANYNNMALPWIWQDTANRMTWDHSRTTQITPYWEGWDKKLKVELSLFQDYDVFDGGRYWDASDNTWTSRNYGQGISGRVRVTPFEGLNLIASGINRMYGPTNNNPLGVPPNTPAFTDNHSVSAVNFGFDWRPCFFPKLLVFAAWTHTWNSGFNRNTDALAMSFGDTSSVTTDVVTGGFAFNVTEQLKFVTQGDYMYSKAKNNYGKIQGWAIYPALRYTLPYGVNFEVGYRYEQLKEKISGDKLKLNTVYGQVGFDF